MELRLLTLHPDPDSGRFPEAPLEGIDGEVVNVIEHFFHADGRPTLLLVVHLRSPTPRRVARPPEAERPDVRRDLDTVERDLFERIRVWRNARATADGLPPFALLTNRQAADLARRRPTTLADLEAVPGVGKQKVAAWGRDLLALVADALGGPPPEVADG